MNRLFVYGTLKRGGGMEGLLGALPRQPARTTGRIFVLPAGYPALAPGPGADVHGECVTGTGDELLALLDIYEGVPEGLFARILIDVRLGVRTEGRSDPRPVRAWAWCMPHPEDRGGRLLASGAWHSVLRR